MKPNIVEFVTDPQLLGLSLSEAQETLLRATYGLPLTHPMLEIFQLCTGRKEAPSKPFGEVTVIAGARAGKDSRIAAPLVTYEALFGGHERALHRGEKGMIVLVAQDTRATKVAFTYIRDYLTHSPLLARSIDDVLTWELTLTNGITIACFPCTLRSMRGFSIPVAVLDELAFFRMEGSADSDAEIQTSVRRGMLSFPHPRLIKISTPYMKSGILHDDFKRSFGQDDPDLLVWRATSSLMNPSLSKESLTRQQRLDPIRFAREYEAEFSEDLSAFLPSQWVEDAIQRGHHELPPRPGIEYVAACDPSGGGADAFTLAVVHVEGRAGERKVVNDVIKGWSRVGTTAPDLVGVVKEIADLLRQYKISRVTGDRYAGQWVRQAFREAHILYLESERDRSQAYLECEPLFATGRILILDHPLMVREWKQLERRPRPGGRTQVDHPSSGHDDHANSVALAASLAIGGGKEPELYTFALEPGDPLPQPPQPVVLTTEEQAAKEQEEAIKLAEEARLLVDRQRRYLQQEGWTRIGG